MILERRRILQNLKEQNLDKEDYEEQKKRILFQLDIQRRFDERTIMHRFGNSISVFFFINHE